MIAISHSVARQPMSAPTSHSLQRDTRSASTPLPGSPDDAGPDKLDNPTSLKKAFAERCNWTELATALHCLLEEVSNAFPGDLSSRQQTDLEALLASRLASRSLPVCEDSSYYQRHKLTPAHCVVSLQAYLRGSGLDVPKTLEALLALYQTATQHRQTHPLGNFSGALSWPTPLALQDQKAITRLLQAPHPNLPELPLADLKKGVLGYLLSASNLSHDDLKKPSNATQTLLASPKAQALGQAIQAHLGGIATTSSVNDYLLAAIHLGLAPESLETPARNSVAGFDLSHRQHWGKPATSVIDGLSRHLVAQGRASTQSADLAARLLLASTAPHYLAKDLAPSLTYGSIPWTQLAIAAAKLEAQSPGRVLTMTYSEVMAAAEDLEMDAALTQLIQRDALSDWGVVNGLLEPTKKPSDADMLKVQRAFTAQQSALQATSIALAAQIPSREAMALDLLREHFPGVADTVFKARHLVKAQLKPGRPGSFPGQYSMLDIVMQGDRVNRADLQHWVTNDKRIPINAFCTKSAAGQLSVADTFDKDYNTAIDAQEKGHDGLARYLISTLPPEDRVNLMSGELEFFHTNEYQIGLDFSTKTLMKRGHTLDVKTTRDGQVNIYRIDTHSGAISKHNYLNNRYAPPYNQLNSRDANILSRTTRFNPFPDEHAQQAKEQPAASQTPQAFDAERTKYIAKVFTNALDLRGDDLLQHARGITAYDKNAAGDKAIGEFFLNLIPLRSAIVNFTKGNVAEGMLDLGLDVIGLVTLGAGKAAQAGKVLTKGVTTVKGATKAARFLGSAAIEAFNPLSGAGDLLKGGVALASAAGRRGWAAGRATANVLRGASGSYDVLKAAGKQHGLAAIGTYKVADQSLEGGALFRNGNWYAYDLAKALPYGAPLTNFQPSMAATAGQINLINKPALLEYEVLVAPDRLQVKGLQANVYVGPNNQEYIKVDGRLYSSRLNDGQRVIQHPEARHADIPVKDLGTNGWQPSAMAEGLLGGSPSALPGWKLNENTYIVPVDDITVNPNSIYPYTLKYEDMNHVASFDSQVGAWSAGRDIDGKNPQYFWRCAKKKTWQKGSLDEMRKARKLDAHQFRFVEAHPPTLLQTPKNSRPLPKDIHYFWAGGEIPASLVANMAANAAKMPGFKSIVHVDADTPQILEAIKLKLEKDAPGITVMDLQQDTTFQSLKNTELYSYFRQGQGKNLAAASDVARYPLMNRRGGLYLDTDDVIKGSVGPTGLHAGDGDLLVSKPVSHKVTNHKPFFNTSNFATQPHNPVLTEMINEMNARFARNKAYFEAHRPTTTRDAAGNVIYTPEFLAYEAKIFETVGPQMFDEVLKAKRPDIYDLGFDGSTKETILVNGHLRSGALYDLEADIRKYYKGLGITPDEDLHQTVQQAKQHYRALRDQLQIEIGAEHSWIDS
jgi:hypothetical protein